MNTTDINIGMAGFRGSVPIVEIASKTDREVYSVADLVKKLGVTRSTIVRWEKNGKLPKRIFKGFGGKVLFNRDVIDSMIESGEL